MASCAQPVISTKKRPLPEWFRQDLPDMPKIRAMQERFRSSGLHTVCESALCPNMGQCWGQGVATFMILGDICTRACRFCAVPAGRPLDVDVLEPKEVAHAVKEMGLRYVVITSVARDDLPDEGAGHFAETIRCLRERAPQTKIEVLIPDFSNDIDCLKTLTSARPDVVSHNIETVRRLSPRVRPQAAYDRSLDVLRTFKRLEPGLITKSSVMLGLGETMDEVEELMRDVLDTGCEILTIGQYLAPTKRKRHLPVEKFWTPQEFDYFAKLGEQMGFAHVESGPLVRSSFIAETGYRKCVAKLKTTRADGGQ